MTPEEHRFNALVLIFANLQRLMVFHNAVALIEGKELDPDLREQLTSKLDLLNEVVARSSQVRAVNEADVDAVRPVALYLEREIRAYYNTELESNLGVQAAFGAAAVFAASYLGEGTMHMGRVFGHDDWVDREMQDKPTFIHLLNQANGTVGSAAKSEFPPQIRGYIDHHVRVALGDRDLVMAQVDGLTTMLDGLVSRRHFKTT
ncbi:MULTISPECIES: hypothetical protein [unclassified Arthrobacter]|uniref:hypothetical protein n=1 Tax=unclassified Arthrobacter TaxID=235627 RepID=UPI002DF9DB69|nr:MULTISPECIES: hypothetical protein [unclassified Arthrobacter]MEC5192611.1 hypothetical protein [Arthrobacter sp. MP_M4]MEC5204095.1 hypothetical protein [Arthrobacter sp. MP_M7]